MAEINIDITGLSETLKSLREYEPDMYKTIVANLKNSAAPLAREVGSRFPDKPLERWHDEGDRRGKARMPAYITAKVRGGVKPAFSAGRRAVGREVGILRLEQRDAGGQVFDTAGSQNAGARFVKNLDKHRVIGSRGNGFRSRVLFPATKAKMPMIEQNVRIAIEQTNKMVSERLARGF